MHISTEEQWEKKSQRDIDIDLRNKFKWNSKKWQSNNPKGGRKGGKEEIRKQREQTKNNKTIHLNKTLLIIVLC